MKSMMLKRFMSHLRIGEYKSWLTLILFRVVTEKVVLASKLISTSKRHAEHLFAGQNTQQLSNLGWIKKNYVMCLRTNFKHALEQSALE